MILAFLFAYKITTFPLTFQIIPHIFYIHPLFFVLNQPSPHQKKAGHPPQILLFWVASDVSLFQPKQKIFLELTFIDN